MLDRRAFLRCSAAFAGATACGLLVDARRNDAAAQSLQDLMKTAPAAGTALFGSTEVSAANLKALPQWARVLAKMKSERKLFHACLNNPAACTTAGLRSWREVATEAKGKPQLEMLKVVNRYFNRWPYKIDRELYGVSEFWATPTEFMKRSGDCEDYSIAKFFALRDLGMANEDLRVVILMDRIRRLGHAVLAVYALGDILILDSLTDLIFSHKKYKHYVPQYSMNETTRWAHFYGKNRTASL
ncbi:transglutaminase-like cysteine peptidase [Pelagibius sp. CAU 1746]|uniref:transglutaminase-like cysteine peptidase n=1 Tax=Pelagibius sp. CAU 1746 TaxID=3140370 RepID=UPI00325B7117